MAYQGDPNRERHRMLQREDGTLKVIPIVLGLVFLLFVGYKLWPHHSTVPRSTTTSIDHLTTAGSPKTTPTQPQQLTFLDPLKAWSGGRWS
jgi:hypothetical protein